MRTLPDLMRTYSQAMATTARLLALLDLLQDRGWVSGDEIGERLEAEPRTVRRDLARLAGLGLPVESRRGRYGGYRLRPGYKLPPLMLTDDEAAAVVVALVSAERLGLATGAPAVTGALSKIRRVLPAALRARTEALEAALGFTRDVSSSGRDAGPQAPVLLGLGEAVRGRRRVRMRYATPGREPRDREVDPYGLVVSGRRWYLSALDHDHGELRVFRVDRVLAVRVGDEAPPAPPGFDPVAAVADALARVPWRWTVELLIDAGPDQVRQRLPAWIATLTSEPDGRQRAILRVEDLDGVVRHLGGLGLPFELVGPEELRPILAAHGRTLIAAAAR